MLSSEYHQKSIIGDVECLVKMIKEQDKEITRLKNAGLLGGVRKMEEYPNTGRIQANNYNIQEELDTYLKQVEEVELKNNEVILHNKKVLEHVIKTLESIGLTQTVGERKSSRSMKRTTVPAGWATDVRNQIPTTDGRYNARQFHERVSRQLKDIQEKLEKEKVVAESNRITREKELKVKRYIVEMSKKYDLVDCVELNDVLHAMLEKDKYLRLAYYLEKNRGDWNDGFSFAETGLSGFRQENETDGLIVECIQHIINAGDVDGRYFRDCEWNYSTIYSLANDDLVTDFCRGRELSEYGSF